MSKVEDIERGSIDIPPYKRKMEEDKETEKIEGESKGGGFDTGGR